MTVALSVVTFSAPAEAQVRPVRVDGYWEPAEPDTSVLGTLELRDEAGKIRAFGVTAAQAYMGATKGMSIFRHSQPRPLRLRGRVEMVEPFVATESGRAVTLFGTYDARNDSITLTKVEYAKAPEIDSSDGAEKSP